MVSIFSLRRCFLLIFVLNMTINGFCKDYLLTIGGGYAPSGNQASLEANVVFFQQVVRDRHTATTEHLIYFADGFDKKDDLQVLIPKSKTDSPAIDFLNDVFDLNRDQITYRDHQVPNIRGGLNPSAVRKGFDEITEKLMAGDRLIVYVTGHGSAAKGNDPHNTSITCWDKRALSMRSFSEWLDHVPETVPVVMIMAQCYCGGFANTMFVDGDADKGLAEHLRAGFFAQRHDLPAAGCRPDIENDEEYSSYFWGAFMGRSRTGKPIEHVDCNGDNKISFAEAHAYAVVASQTIDIPLKTSEAFLRKYSRIAGYEDSIESSESETKQGSTSGPELLYISGTVDEIASKGTPDQRRMVIGLANQLQIPLEADVSRVFLLNNEQHDLYRQSRRSSRRGRGSRRRDLRAEIIEKWPEIANPNTWAKLDWLKADQSELFLQQARQLPNFQAFQQSQTDRKDLAEKSTVAELNEVKFRRLIYSLETIVYAQNLPFVASPEEIEKYQAILKIEGMLFDQTSN